MFYNLREPQVDQQQVNEGWIPVVSASQRKDTWHGRVHTESRAAAVELLLSAPRDSPGVGAWEENHLIALRTSFQTNFRMS